MSNGVNKIFLIGRCGADPEVRYLQSGNAVATLRLAVSERVKEGDTWKDGVLWIDVITWGKTAENAAQYVKKGHAVHIEGRLQIREFTDKDGNKRTKAEVAADRVTFLSGGADRSQSAPAPKSGPADLPSIVDNGAATSRFIDDDLPF